MSRHGLALAGLLALVALGLSVGGCAVLCPDHFLRSTVTLAPNQAVSGRFEVLRGGRCVAQFWRQEPRKGIPPFPEATAWTGDGLVMIAFPDSPIPEETGLGYAQLWLEEGRVYKVVVRNAGPQAVTFTWAVTGASDVAADWNLTGDDMSQ